MRTTEVRLEDVQAAADMIPEDVPFFMLILLRFREHADYGDSMDVAPSSGREVYHGRYVPAFGQIAAQVGAEGIQFSWVGSVLARVVGPAEERWDEMAIVEYPSFAAFRRVTESPEYEAQAAPHRMAALEDLRLIATAKVS